MSKIEIEYVANSLVGNFKISRLQEYTESFANCYEYEKEIKFPKAYIDHVKTYHGGIPKQKCFKTESGKIRFIGRFLNFLREEDIEDEFKPSWRPGSIDIRLDYSIWEHGHNSGKNWERIDNLIPFAGIDTVGHDCKGMSEMDLLCFYYNNNEDSQEPEIVTWSYHKSSENHIVTEFVAKSFDELLEMLFICPNDLAVEDNEVSEDEDEDEDSEK
jgi:hypothetical protein